MSDGMILLGDCRESLRSLPAQSVHCVVTSPPYFGLRDYGVDGQIGLEPSPDEFVEAMVSVFREVHRVLRADGTLWLNLGDSYAANRSYQVSQSKHQAHDYGQSNSQRVPSGMKSKDLIGIPWMVAFAMRADGWYLRQEIIWHKPNVMPESVRDRCTKAHETIFMFSKRPKYFFDHEAIKEPAVSDHPSGNGFKRAARLSYQNSDGSARGNEQQWTGVGGLRNKRSVWSVNTKPFKEAHFATYPPDLIEPCILAGCPVGGTVLDPFFGAGTTGLVAQQNDRRWIGCELNPKYADIARRRLGLPDEYDALFGHNGGPVFDPYEALLA